MKIMEERDILNWAGGLARETVQWSYNKMLLNHSIYTSIGV